MNTKEMTPIKGFEGVYEIDKIGAINSVDRFIKTSTGTRFFKGKSLALSISSNGYKSVSLYVSGKRSSYLVHQLMAITFLNHTPCGYDKIIDHKDNNRLNNKLDNIQITTMRVNSNKDKTGYTSRFDGVSFDKACKTNKWAACIYYKGRNKRLGHFKTEELASEAYQIALKQI